MIGFIVAMACVIPPNLRLLADMARFGEGNAQFPPITAVLLALGVAVMMIGEVFCYGQALQDDVDYIA
ncbi:MAG: hypothetical protein MR006_07235 [Arcanobacterium sp.]|nr:hypothetical protein [Arcanobacterium sp.]